MPEDTDGTITPADLRELILELASTPDRTGRVRDLSLIVDGLDSSHKKEIEALVRDPWIPFRVLERLVLLNKWAELDPQRASAWATREAAQAVRIGAVEIAVSAWARRQPDAVAAHFRQPSADVVTAAISGWFESGEPGLEDYVLSQPDSEIWQRAIGRYARELARREGADALASWAVRASMAEDEKLGSKLLRRVVSELAISDPEAAIAFCEEHCETARGGALRPVTAERVVAVTGDGRRVLDWLAGAERADVEERARAARLAFLGWAQADRDAALAWADAIPSANREAAWLQKMVPAVVGAASWKSPRKAIEWALLIDDASQRELALESTVRRWRGVDIESAEEWLESSPLSQASRERARRYPANYRGPRAK